MKRQAYEQLTLFREDSRVSRSPLPGSEEARTMTVTSGLRCLELYANSGPLGCLVRMCLGSSIWHSTRCLLTWKRKDTPARHSIYQLAVSMPHTEDSGSQLWPTVTTDTASARTKRYKQGGMPLAVMLQMYPTPTTGAGLCGGTGNFKTLQRLQEIGKITEEERRQLSQGNGGKANPDFLEWLMGYEQKFTTLIPTPRASDANGAALNSWYSQTVQVERERERERGKYHSKLNELVQVTPLGRIGPMNPEWVEWLMGYPIGWTELKPLETR